MIRKKVLVIDDSPIALKITSHMLQDAGYIVFTAINGIEANSFIYSKESKPDLILMDVMMPLLSGNRKADMLKNSDYSKEIPIVFISAKEDAELKKLVAESNVNGYIRKPFMREELLAVVQSNIGEKT